jgi:3-oxoacyl-[acyl-carrier protein] reductase
MTTPWNTDRGLVPPVAVIVGATGAIGRAVAEQAASRNEGLGLWGHSHPERLEALADEIRRTYEIETHAVVADIADRDATAAAVAELHERFGPPGTVVASSGIRTDGLLWAQDPDVWTRMIDVNLVGTYNVLRAVVPAMVKQRAGRIVAVVSPSGLHGNRGQSAYAASKAGVVAMIRSLAAEVGKRGITANAVAPGYVASEITDDVPAEVIESLLASTALQRPITADEVASAIIDLADNGAITGQVLSVDGGLGGLTG